MNESNITLNEDNDKFDFYYGRLWSENVELVCNIIVIILGIPTNCWSISRYWKLWRLGRANRRVLLGLNLTMSNLLLVLLHCTGKTAALISIIWPWGESACKARSFTSVLVHHLSSNAVVVIAWEMFYTLHRPLEARTTRGFRRALTHISVCIILALLCSGPQLWTWGVVDIPNTHNQQQCDFLFHYDHVFLTVYELCHVISVFYIPLSLIVICYIACGVVVRRQLRKREHLQEMSRSSVSLHDDKEHTRHSIRSIRSIISFRARKRTRSGGSLELMNTRVKRRLLKVSIAVILTYVVCWLPYQALSLWAIILNIQSKEKPALFQYMYCMEALLLTTVFLNPVLYTYHGF